MNKLVTVSGNKGKSVFAFFLAKYLSAHGKRTVLVSSDGKKPMFSLLFPTRKEQEGHSIGKLLSLSDISEIEVFNNAQVISKELLMLSYSSSDNDRAYPDITQTALEAMYAALQNMCEIIVVDCSTVSNAIDRFFLPKSNYKVCITTADGIGLEYRRYYDTSDHHHILFRESEYNSVNDILSTFHTKPVLMPYFSIFECIYNGYDITDISLPAKYKKTIQIMVGDINDKSIPQT